MLRRSSALVFAALLCGTVLTACSSTPAPPTSLPGLDDQNDQPGPRPGPPFPAGAILERPGEVSPGQIDTIPGAGSLRPDDKLPSDRVPIIKKRGRLIVGIDQSQNLLSYRNPVTGELEGFEVDLAREIARDIFGNPDATDFRFIDSADRVEALRNRDVDIIIRTMTLTESRQKDIDFSIPYLDSSTRMLTIKNSGINNYDDLKGRTACVASGTTAVDIARQNLTDTTLMKTRRWSDCMLALQQHQVNAIIADDTILSGIAAQDPFTTIAGTALSPAQYGVGIRKSVPSDDSSGLVRQVNSTIERIGKDGTWSRMYSHWLGAYLQSSSAPQPRYREEGPQ